MMFSLVYDLDLIKDFPAVLILLPLMLFMSSWPQISRLLKHQKTLWFVRLASVFLLISFLFSFKDFIDYKKMDHAVLNASIEHVFNLNLPKTQSHQTFINRTYPIEIYIVKDTTNSTPAIFISDIHSRYNINNLNKGIKKELANHYSSHMNDATVKLLVDDSVPMKYVNEVIHTCHLLNINSILFFTGRKYSKYPTNYPGFENYGILKTMPVYYSDFTHFLDSAEQLDFSGKAIKLNESIFYRQQNIKQYNRIEINVKPNSVTLNKQKIKPPELEAIIYKFYKKYSPDCVVIFNSADDVSYARYIQFLDMIYTQIDRLRNEESEKFYHHPFQNDQWDSGFHQIVAKYPRNIIEWTEEEKRLNKLIQKAHDNNQEQK
ncbi:hypothetical protein [Fulvivirga ligni]|uniref:hypothetical protein n=1 Tax=Fulvivirga ligni TaxID=2904246 RepID=UPI001F1BC97A|nr:hypothetical protein [Fulvivirga ligni]UII19922.1 hypothetical protein LVD16_18940 [Fulvivirga ligni]